MIDNDDLKTIWQTAEDITTVVEFYPPDAVPGDDGFDPADAIALFAAIGGLEFGGMPYRKQLTSIGNTKKSTGKQTRTGSVTLSNLPTNAIKVTGAGTETDNGIFPESGTHNSKPYYNRIGVPPSPAYDAIVWNSTPAWAQYNPTNGLEYASFDDTATPDLGTWGSYGAGVDDPPRLELIQYRFVSGFEYNYRSDPNTNVRGFEGTIMVIRSISRSLSDSLDKSQIIFAGRCDKPTGGNKESLTINATWVLGRPEVIIPRRKYSRDDMLGRAVSDPEFEGFRFMPQYGESSYSVRVKKGGILGLFGFKKTVKKTLQWSSFSDLDEDTDVTVTLGVGQILGVHIAYVDVGNNIHIRTSFGDGPAYQVTNYRSTNPAAQPMQNTDGYPVITPGYVGAINRIGDDWPGPGAYSRTIVLIGKVADDPDLSTPANPAPDIAAVVYGMLMTIPDGSGDWTVDDAWTANGAAHVRYLMTCSDYLNIDPSWLNDADFTETYNYNAGLVIRKNVSDLLYLIQ